MTTPNITAGVLERLKPVVYRPNVVWRFEAVISGGSAVTTPIFDIVGDGRPLTDVEIGSAAIIRVPSNKFGIAILVQTTPNMRLNINLIQDNGGQQPYRTLYVPQVDNVEVQLFEFVCPGRRCQFRLSNTPLGTGASSGSDTRFEITNEG